MILNLVLLTLAILLVITLLYRQRAKQQPQVPAPHNVIYQDHLPETSPTLMSKRYFLLGRPDRIEQHGEFFIPVEVKTGRPPEKPYLGQIMQVIAYCVMVQEKYGKRPPYGIIHYEQSNTTVQIEFTPAYEKQLAGILRAMRAKRAASDVKRSHDSTAKCAVCDYKDRCPEKLVQDTTTNLSP